MSPIREEFLGLPEIELRMQALIQKDLLDEDEVFELTALTAHRDELLRIKELYSAAQGRVSPDLFPLTPEECTVFKQSLEFKTLETKS